MASSEAAWYKFANLAEHEVRIVEDLNDDIAGHVQKAFKKYGNSQLPMVKLEGDHAFTSAISDRNRHIQMAIMYSSMAIMYK